MGHLNISRLIPAPVDQVFDHISRIENLPEWLVGHLVVEFPATPPKLREQVDVEVVMKRFGFPLRKVMRVEAFEPGHRLSYRQVAGFFRKWTHTQVLRAHDEQTTLLTDLVEFRLPLGIIGAFVDDVIACRDIERTLSSRLERIEEHFTQNPPLNSTNTETRPASV
jgi:ligand-binding SRPBCC domain-containing protein